MANSFVNTGAALSTTNRTTVYTCPANTQAIIHAVYLSNVDGTASVDVTVEATDDGGTTYRKIGYLLPVPARSTLVLDKPVNLEAADILAVTASAAGDVEVFLSVLQVT
jgi:hypothetical protein|tara:strand:- start:449 stop:775 length:327 start_codon:yes stop_codon:yes gene_type:complete